MKPLTQALKKILNVWQQNREELVSLLQPGLSTEEIQEQFSDLPFCIPQEVYHLYQWRNGILIPRFFDFVVDFLPGFRFLSLAEAVNEFRQVEELRQKYLLFIREHPFLSDKYCHKPWFPIFTGESRHLIILGGESMQKFSPVIDISWKREEVVKFKYPNLTKMMAVVAECYETGAYYIETEIICNQVVEFLAEDVRKVAQIQRKYNLKKLGVSLQN